MTRTVGLAAANVAGVWRGICMGIALAAMLAGATLMPGAAQAQQRLPPTSREGIQLSFAPIVKKAAPAVVNVFVRGRVAVRSPFDDPILRELFGDRLGMPRERIQSSLGSGVIVSPEGIVVTNTHVIKVGAQSEIRVVLADKREFEARVILQDEKADIAVLKIEGGEGAFPFLKLGDSDDIEVGDLVLAIGNPFGVGQSVSQGIISALGRSVSAKSDAPAFIQTDAAVNPGNSGGALVDVTGRLIGINTAIISRSGASHGIGFAVPSNLVRVFVESAIAGRKVERPWLGARLEPVTQQLAKDLGLARASGALVGRVLPDGPAAEAGLEPGDVIVAVDGLPVTDPQELQYRLTTRGVGQTVQLSLLRQGRERTVAVSLRGPPEADAAEVRNLTGQHPLSGARVGPLSPAVAQELGIADDEGIVVLQVARGSIAERLRLQRGDLVVGFDGQAVTSTAALEEALRARAAERLQQAQRGLQRTPWVLAIKRNGQMQQVVLR